MQNLVASLFLKQKQRGKQNYQEIFKDKYLKDCVQSERLNRTFNMKTYKNGTTTYRFTDLQ